MINKKYLLTALLLSGLFFLLSFLSYLYPAFNQPLWLGVIILLAILAGFKLRLAVYFALGELMIGSFGYLLAWPLGNNKISLRLGIFAMIMLVWLIKAGAELITEKKLTRYFTLRHSQLFKWYIGLILVILAGAAWGYLRGNQPSNVFFDANAWLFFFYLLPMFDVLDRDKLKEILGLLAGANLAVFILTFFSFVAFTQNWQSVATPLYGWLRDYRIGEITFAGGNLWRIFFQSQVYSAVGAAIWFWLWANEEKIKIKSWNLFLFIFSSLTVVISLSRSFWLGCGASGVLVICYLLFAKKAGIKRLTAIGLILILILAGELLLVRMIAGAGSGDLLAERLTDINGVAGASRWNQLIPLGAAIARHPLIGSGFGATATYQSLDPRIVKAHPDGWYTTYAFEWGYLDIILKIGTIGLLVYLIFIGLIIKGLKSQIQNPNVQMGLLAGLVVILVANVFTPYLNHPLGIGYLLILASTLKN
ncbi:MAG: hypothetical protein WCT37_02100 [Patescibacteria group bacterium]|jgi:O-antigen ligase